MNRIKALLSRLWSIPLVRKAVHTFWQTFTVVFLAGVSNLLSAFVHGGLAAGQSALIALVLAASAAGLSALKTIIIGYVTMRQNDGSRP